MTVKLRTTMFVLLVAVSTAAAVIIGPFTSWDELTKKSPDIIIARCATAPNSTVIGDGMIWSDIEVLAVLKGDTKPGVARMVSLYWPHQDERFLMFATYQSNQLYQAYNAPATYRIVPISRDFPTNELTGKTLDEQIQSVLRRRLEDVNRELERDAEEKSRLALAVSGNLTGSPSPYEIVLEGENVVFDKAESVSMQIRVRNLGMKKVIAPELYWGLSVVWDGKEYKRDPKHIGLWNIPGEIIPKGVFGAGFSLSDYLVPTEVLTAGRHAIALKDAFAESNTLTVFTEKTSVREAAWGEPIEEVSARLRADKTKWATNETPTFEFDVRNQGQREFGTTQSQKTGRLEVDGVWYRWTGRIDLKGSWLPPGREYHDIPVSLGSDWKATQEWRDKTQAPPSQIPLKLLPGKHTIRFAAEIRDRTVKPKPQNHYVPSNPVVIQID